MDRNMITLNANTCSLLPPYLDIHVKLTILRLAQQSMTNSKLGVVNYDVVV